MESRTVSAVVALYGMLFVAAWPWGQPATQTLQAQTPVPQTPAIGTLALRTKEQKGIDLFSDVPGLASGFLRLGSWNVRHFDVTDGARAFLPGRSREEDFAVLMDSFAKAIRDLGLDIVLLIEVQPRAGEPDRLAQLIERLNGDSGFWKSLQTHIAYDQPDDPFGNLQFAILWNAARGVVVDRDRARLMESLRQPRDEADRLLSRDQRVPWLIPISASVESRSQPAGSGHVDRLAFDLLAIHFKSGGGVPQSAEVDAVSRFIASHQAGTPHRHLVVAGDWNIRPDENTQGRGRPRLKKLMVPQGNSSLMRLLTVGELPPSLEEWDDIDQRLGVSTGPRRFAILKPVLPFSHIDGQNDGFDALLDHLAISRSLDELFDHPLQVTLANGEQDLRPGIEIARPLLPLDKFVHFTDHLPVILTLRIASVHPESRAPRVRIAAVEPNPIGDESQCEEVHLRNISDESISLLNWRIEDSSGHAWRIDDSDRMGLSRVRLGRGRTAVVRRNGRAMSLNNSGDTLHLIDDRGALVDTRSYGEARTGELIRFP